MFTRECGPLWSRFAITAIVVLVVPLILMAVNKVNRTMRLVPNRYMGWLLVAVKCWVCWNVMELAWCATTPSQGAHCRAAASDLWSRFRTGRDLSMGSLDYQSGAAWYFFRPILPTAVFDPSFVAKERVDILDDGRVLFRQVPRTVVWMKKRGPGNNVAITSVDAHIGGPVYVDGGGVFENPRL